MMKKLCLLVLIMVLGKISYSQYPIVQNIGSDSAIVVSKGALQSRLVNQVYSDTGAANLQRIRQYPGAQIVTNGAGMKIWLRNNDATRWLQIPAGSGVGNIYTIDGTLTGERELDGNGYALTFETLRRFNVGGDTVFYNVPYQQYRSLTQDFILSDSLAKLVRSGAATVLVNSTNGSARLVLNPDGPMDEKKYEVKALNEEFWIAQISDNETLGDTIFFAGNNRVGIKTNNPRTGIELKDNTYVAGQFAAGDTINAAGTYAIQGATFSPYIFSRKAVDTLQSSDPRNIAVLGQTIARGPVSNRLVGGAFFTQTDSSNSQNISQLRALQGWTIHNGTGTVTNAWGSYNVITNNQTGTITNAYGSVSGVENRSTGYIPKLHGQSLEVWNLGGGAIDTVFGQTVSIYNSNPASTIGAAYGVSIGKGMITTTGGTHYWRNSGTINKSYGLYLDTSIDVGLTEKYAIYSFSRSNSYFNGNVGIGTSSPTSKLHVYDSLAPRVVQIQNRSVGGNIALDVTSTGVSGLAFRIEQKDSATTGTQYVGIFNKGQMAGTGNPENGAGVGWYTNVGNDAGVYRPLSVYRARMIDSTGFANTSVKGSSTEFWTRKNNAWDTTLVLNQGNVGVGTGQNGIDSSLTVANGTWLKSGVRLSGLPAAPGTKALRINSNGTLSVADTLIDAGGTVTSIATNNGTGITGGTITTSGTLAIDTLLVSTRAWRQKGIDSVAALANSKINGTLISGYLTKATGSLTIDTSQLYQNSGLIGIGTTTPAAKLDVNGKIQITGPGNWIKYDSYGYFGSGSAISGGASSDIGIRSENKILFSSGGAIQRMLLDVSGNLGIGGSPDSLLTVELGTHLKRGVRMSGLPAAPGTKALRIDANGTISTSDTLIDAGGTVTSVATNTGTGITGGTITTSGTLAIDTLLISTRAWRQKGIDSVASLINTNVSGTTNYIPKFTSSSAIGNSAIYDNGGEVLIGTTTDYGDYKLQVNGNILGVSGNIDGNDNISLTAINYGTNGTTFSLNSKGTSGIMTFLTANSERMRLDASGRLLVGGTSTYDFNDAAKLVVANSGNSTITIASGTTSIGYLAFADGTSGTDRYTGNIAYNHSTNSMVFAVNGGAEAMRLDASGNLGLGTSSPVGLLEVVKSGTARLIIGYVGGSANYYDANEQFFRAGNGTTRLTLDASGNLGLGVTPSAWGSGFAVAQYKGGFIGSQGSPYLYIGQNAYYDGTNWLYATTAAVTLIEQSFGSYKWYQAPSGTAGNAISFTQAMTLDASGRLGIGVTNPSTRLDVNGVGTFQTGFQVVNGGAGLSFAASRLMGQMESANMFRMYITGQDASTKGGLEIYNATSTGSPTIGLAITASSNVGIGTTSPSTTLHTFGRIRSSNTNTSGVGDAAGVIELGDNVSGIFRGNANSITNAGNFTHIGGYDGIIFTASNAVLGSQSERMRITSGGDVGIGVTSPGAKLEVNGAIKTAAPSGGTAKPFKIGAAAVVSPTSPNRTIEIEIDGVTYYLSAKTTND